MDKPKIVGVVYKATPFQQKNVRQDNERPIIKVLRGADFGSESDFYKFQRTVLRGIASGGSKF